MNLVVQPRERLDRRVNHHDGQNEGEKVRLFRLLVLGEKLHGVLNVKKHERDAGGPENFHELTGNFVGADDAHQLADVFFGGGAELRADGFFQVVGFDDAVAGEGFMHQVGQFGVVFLHGAGGFADFAAINHNRHDAHGKHDDGNQCQRGVRRELKSQQDDDGDGIFDGGRKRTADDAGKHLRVVGDARDQIAGAGAVEKAERKILQMAEQFRADVGDGMHGRPVGQVNAQVLQQVPQEHDGGARADDQRQTQSVIRGGRGNGRHQLGEPVRERMNPFRRRLQFFVQINGAFKNQLNHDPNSAEEHAVGQSVKNPAEQAEKKTSAIRPDEAPELAEKINHVPTFFTAGGRKRGFYAASRNLRF